MYVYRLLEQGSGLGESSAELIFGDSQENKLERMFPKVSVKTTGAVIPLNKGKHTFNSDHPTSSSNRHTKPTRLEYTQQ